VLSAIMCSRENEKAPGAPLLDGHFGNQGTDGTYPSFPKLRYKSEVVLA
jgi:hypothetical protein